MKYLFYTLLLLFSFNLQAQTDTIPPSSFILDADLALDSSYHYVGFGNSIEEIYTIDTVKTYLEIEKKYQIELNVVTGKLNQLDHKNVYNIPKVIELRQDIQWRMFVLEQYRSAETLYFDPYTYTLPGADVSKCVAIKKVDLSYENYQQWKYQNYN